MPPEMGWILLAAFALVFYVLIRSGAKMLGWITGTRFRAYRLLAAKYHGRYENRGMSDPPTVSFNYNGSTVRVGLAPQFPGQPTYPRTRVVARFARGLPFRMELAPIGRPAPAQPPKGTRPVRVGDAEFDRSFIVQANDPEMARDFLTAPVRWALANLLRLGPPGGVLVSINPERMLVQVDRNLGASVDSLANGVREALAIHDGLQSGVAARLGEGVSIVAAGPASAEDAAGPPTCKVCGDPIAGPGSPKVYCSTCRTPHHRDCWDFIGACSVFGCKGKTASPG
jgi:Prokaryotic RING finger family 1